MTAVTLRPDATILAGTVTGAASTHAALSDNSDASYVVRAGSNQGIHVDMGTVIMPVGAITSTVQTRGRFLGAGIAARMELRTTSGVELQRHDFQPTTGAGITNVVAGATPVTLSQAQVTALNVFSRCVANSHRHIELYVDLVYVEQPAVTVTPVLPDPYTASTLVPLAWVNTLDADGGAQSRYQIRVFTAAQYGVGGFDPATSPATFDSGQVVGSATAANIGPLPSATYRAYVRVAQTVNGASHWSAWAFDPFAVAVTTSDVASVAVAPSNASGSIAVTVTRAGASAAWNLIEVQRSTDAGASWSYVRGAAYVDCTANASTFAVTDYEVSNGAAVVFRARATRIVSGLPITGAWVSSASTSWSSTATWLKAPGMPALNMSTICMASRTPYRRGRRAGVFHVLGSRAPVVVSDVRSARSGMIEWEILTAGEAAALDALLDAAPVVLVQFPPSMDIDDMYAAITADDELFLSPVADQVWRSWGIEYAEVPAPPDPLAGV